MILSLRKGELRKGGRKRRRRVAHVCEGHWLDVGGGAPLIGCRPFVGSRDFYRWSRPA